jgi:hypothetical protein
MKEKLRFIKLTEFWQKLRHGEFGRQIVPTKRHRDCYQTTFDPTADLRAIGRSQVSIRGSR